jgi:DNA polymerase-3 subunit alpha
VVTAVSRQISRRDSSEWGKITVEDFKGTATVLAFGDAWQKHKEVLRQDAVVEIVGRVSGRERDEEDPPIFLDSARPLEDVTPELAVQIELELGSDVAAAAFEAAKKVIAAHPGPSPVWIQVGPDNGERAPRLRSRSLRVEPDADALGALQKLFGRGNVRLVRTVTPSEPERPEPRGRPF